MQTSVSVEIDRPIEEVFEFANDHIAEWSLTVVEDEVLEHKEGEVGTTFRCVTEEKGRRMEFQGEVTRHDAPNDSAAILRGQYFDIDTAYHFDDLGDGRTRMTQTAQVHGKGFVKVMFFLMGWALRKSGCKAQENELLNLKKILEARARA